MPDQPEIIRDMALKDLDAIASIEELEQWRVRYLGRKGDLTQILRSLAELPIEERKSFGARANQVRSALEECLLQKELTLNFAQTTGGNALLDITLPGKPQPSGSLHPITKTMHEICDIFSGLGFQIVEGPEVEWDYYNFEALNIPPEHPARDTQSTFWVGYATEDGVKPSPKPMLLRTQTTSVTARTLETNKPPIMVVEPGKVYRYEASDATHGHMFHQIDGIVVGKNITMADLKGTLYEFAHRYFGGDRRVRFRCDYFPFVEPGVEMAIECAVCRGAGCRLCSGSGWIEVLGAGMTHPEVLRRGGIDPNEYSSFAFGIGIERLPMLRYGIDDLRLFYGSDLRFLRQF